MFFWLHGISYRVAVATFRDVASVLQRNLTFALSLQTEPPAGTEAGKPEAVPAGDYPTPWHKLGVKCQYGYKTALGVPVDRAIMGDFIVAALCKFDGSGDK